MKKDVLEKMLSEGKSVQGIAKELNMGFSTVQYWRKKYGLKCNYHSFNSKEYSPARKPYSSDEIQLAVSQSKNYSDIFRALGLKINGGSFPWIKKLIKKFNISTDHFEMKNINLIQGGHRATFKRMKEIYGNTEDVSNGERLSSKKLRTFLLFKGREEKCEECGLFEWQNVKIRLDIHHKDGNCHNNHFDNLQFICPNCHRQKTITYKESRSWSKFVVIKERIVKKKEPKMKINNCVDCSVSISPEAKRCIPCGFAMRNKINWPPNEILQELVQNFSLLSLSKKLGVSSVSIKKHCNTRNIIVPNTRRKPYVNDDIGTPIVT